jgi:site-specific recombinase XerD
LSAAISGLPTEARPGPIVTVTCRACPWWGRCKRARVSLEKWSGSPIANKEAAKKVLARMVAAVLAQSFDKRGERKVDLSAGMTFDVFLTDYTKSHVEEDGLTSNSTSSYVKVFRKRFGEQHLSTLSRDPYTFETWLKDQCQKEEWANATYNRYVEHGRAMFNWAKARKFVDENPFLHIGAKPEHNKRERRITPEQEQELFNACERLDTLTPTKPSKVTPELLERIRARAASGELQKDIAAEVGLSRPLISQIVNRQVWNPDRRQRQLGAEMRRRLIGALDLGLRAGEMLLLQVKHVDFDCWTVHLPASMTKADRDQQVFAMTPRVQKTLNERKALGPDAFIFGREDGRYVASFDKTWKRLFVLAGLPTGRKSGLVWHDLRHEYGSYLVEQGGTIQEVKELMRHADIRTTARYLSATEERLRQLAGTLGRRA